MVVTGCQENKSCIKVLNFLERLGDRIKNIERYGPRVANVYFKCNQFWTQVFKAYDEFHNKIKLTNAGEVLSGPVCFNQRIRGGNTFLMHKHWIDKYVYCVAHFLNENGKILSHIDFQRKFELLILRHILAANLK